MGCDIEEDIPTPDEITAFEEYRASRQAKLTSRERQEVHCKKCDSDWNTSTSVSVCPFCGCRLDAGKQEHDIRSAFVQTLETYGLEILSENTRLVSLLADYAPQYAKERALIKNALSIGVAKIFLDANGKPDDERQRALLIARRDLKDKLYLDDNGIDIIAACFTSAFRWQANMIQDAPMPETPVQQENKSSNTVTLLEPQPQSAPKFATVVRATGIAAEILQGKKRNLQFGDYKWRLLALDAQCDKALIITEDIIEKRCYNEAMIDSTWETCTLRKYLNGDFYNKFDDWYKARMLTTNIANPDNPEYGTKGGNDTTDNIFLLSIDEARKYFSGDSDRVANHAGRASWWYLRSPGRLPCLNDGRYEFRAAPVRHDGSVFVRGYTVNDSNGGVRPALWLNLKS